ncbi:MAG TPA: DUF2946 domain-containing protein [Ottowia sp.]|nr:DUF2946 domain-containing protein [Ottowia sp.]
MSTWRKRGCWAGRLAMLVIGLAMLAPTVSRMLGHHGGVPRAGWIEVCSSSGIHRVPQGSAAVERDGVPALAAYGDCPLCLLAGDRLAPPPRGYLLVLRGDLGHVAPATSTVAARATMRLLAGQPRGPPGIHAFFEA